MSGLYKNPITPLNVLGANSVSRTSTYGTNFSVLGIGGYMEVFNISDLFFTVPTGSSGYVEFSGNTIPIQLQKGTGSIFSPDVLTLGSDNISSGRRRLGMLAYVQETQEVYQFQIPNYQTLWNNATGATGPGGSTVVISQFGTTVKSNTAAGIAFINAWTGNTVEDYNGGDSNSTWRKFTTGGQGSGISAFTYNNNSFTIFDVTGGTYVATVNNFTGLTVNGSFSATTYLGLPPEIVITGGTYDSNTGTATFTNNTGGTFNVTGFLTGFTDIYVTGGTYYSGSSTIDLRRNDDQVISITGITSNGTSGT
jgi:hypothetical protein